MTLKFRKFPKKCFLTIWYEYANEWGEHILKQLFLSIFCWHYRYLVSTDKFPLTNKTPKTALLLGEGVLPPPPPPPVTLEHLHYKNNKRNDRIKILKRKQRCSNAWWIIHIWVSFYDDNDSDSLFGDILNLHFHFFVRFLALFREECLKLQALPLHQREVFSWIIC